MPKREVVHPPLQRIEIDIRHLPLFGGFGFSDTFVGSRLSAVPNRLGSPPISTLYWSLFIPRHPYAVLGKHTGQRIGGTRARRFATWPAPKATAAAATPAVHSKACTPRLRHQVTAPDFAGVPRQQTARVERQLGAGRTPDQQTIPHSKTIRFMSRIFLSRRRITSVFPPCAVRKFRGRP